MLSTTNFRKGLKLKLEGEIYIIVDFQHARTAQRRAFVRTKMKNLKTGAVLESTISAGENFEEPDFEEKVMQFLYSDENGFVFMDTNNYEQITITAEQLGENRWYLQENVDFKILFFEGNPLSLDLPSAVILKVVSTEPAVRGDTVTGATKPATLETGLVVKVPLFVQEGTKIKVDTRSGEDLERA